MTDAELLSRLPNVEDATVERKTAADYRDCLKTAVALSNSLPIDDPGVIFVGVFDDGRIEDDTNLESLQRKVSAEIDRRVAAVSPRSWRVAHTSAFGGRVAAPYFRKRTWVAHPCGVRKGGAGFR